MATATKKFQVDITTNPSTIIQTPEPVASNFPSTIPVASIIAVTPIYFDFTSYLPPVPAAVITAYAAGPNVITIAGEHAIEFVGGQSIVISGSTSNDGTYTVISAANVGGDTEITVVEAIVAIPVDGTLAYTPTTGTVENNDSGDSFRETYPYKRMTRIVMDLHDGLKLEWELQSITNQPTWSTGDMAGLTAALNAINALL